MESVLFSLKEWRKGDEMDATAGRRSVQDVGFDFQIKLKYF